MARRSFIWRSKKDYSVYIRPPKVSAGYVIMFVPNAGALWSALKIVSLTWTQVAQAQNHEKVYELANEMIDRVGQFMERYEAVGKALLDVDDIPALPSETSSNP